MVWYCSLFVANMGAVLEVINNFKGEMEHSTDIGAGTKSLKVGVTVGVGGTTKSVFSYLAPQLTSPNVPMQKLLQKNIYWSYWLVTRFLSYCQSPLSVDFVLSSVTVRWSDMET